MYIHCFQVPGLLVDKAEDTEGDCADKVYNQILHGIVDTNVQITTVYGIGLSICSMDYGICNIMDDNRCLATGWIKGDSANVFYDEVLLHIDEEEVI